MPTKVRILPDDDSCPELPIVERRGRARALAWPGAGAHLRSVHRIDLEPSGATIPLRHPMEAVYYLVSGVAAVDSGNTTDALPLKPGAMVLIDPGTPYRFVSTQGCVLVGGPCPADPAMYTHLSEIGPDGNPRLPSRRT